MALATAEFELKDIEMGERRGGAGEDGTGKKCRAETDIVASGDRWERQRVTDHSRSERERK